MFKTISNFFLLLLVFHNRVQFKLWLPSHEKNQQWAKCTCIVYTVLYSSAENEVSIDFWRQDGSKFKDVLNRGLNEAALFYYRFRNTLTVLVCKYFCSYFWLNSTRFTLLNVKTCKLCLLISDQSNMQYLITSTS